MRRTLGALAGMVAALFVSIAVAPGAQADGNTDNIFSMEI